MATVTLCGCASTPQEQSNPPKVYMTTDISAEGLVKVYDALGVEPQGNVAVKISTGEPGGHNYLKPALIKNLVQKVNGTIVECNTAYAGRRNTQRLTLRLLASTDFSISPMLTLWMQRVKLKFP